MSSRPWCLSPLLVTAAMMASATGCQGTIEGGDPGGREEFAACTSYHACCPPADLVCEGDVDTSALCTCRQLWTCHPDKPQTCEATRVVPPASGSWSCSWSQTGYTCTRPGSDNPLPGAQGQWTCASTAAGWACSTTPPNPSNTPGGETVWDCSVDNAGDTIACLRIIPPTTTPACVPTAEVCGNSKDDDCDGMIDCDDADCAATCKPQQCTSYPEQMCAIPNCNTHSGDDEAACMAAGNAGGCTATELKAWCRRRVDPEPNNLWYQIHQQWVDDRCGGSVTYTDVNGKGVYSCVDKVACTTFTCVTPLVLVFEPGAGVVYRAPSQLAPFDLSAAQDGSGVTTDWPTAATPWLVLDRDGDGVISSGRELFGSATLVDGQPASNGFEALAPLDANHDGVLDARDPGFARLALWSDRDGDRISAPAELTSLATADVVSLSLRVDLRQRCDPRGNCAMEHAAFTWRGTDGQPRRGEVVDVHLVVHAAPAARVLESRTPTCDATFSLDAID